MPSSGHFIKFLLKKGYDLIISLRDSSRENWTGLTLSEKSLVITCAIMFSGAVSTFIINLDNFRSVIDISKLSEEVLIEIFPKQNSLSAEKTQPSEAKKEASENNKIQPDTHLAFNENSKKEKGINESIAEVEHIKQLHLPNYHDYIVDKNSEAVEEVLTITKEKQTETKILLRKIAKLKKINNRNSTVRYNLKDREAINISTPTYTCENKGVMFVNILVNKAGQVVEAVIDRGQSSQEDGCLEKNAIEYANKALFAPSESSDNQKGTIIFLYFD